MTSIAESSVWGGWSLDRATALELAAYYRREQPRTIVEAGSGYSTLVAAEYAKTTGAKVISLDHDQIYAERTWGLLRSRQLDGYATVRHAPLVKIPTPTEPAWWYGTTLPPDIDFALIDGPPGRIGRRGALYGIRPHLNPQGWQIWLDDADRAGEQDALAEWQTNLNPIAVRHVRLPRGLAVITPSLPPQTWVSNLVISILTGKRPGKLVETIKSFEDSCPGVLSTATVIICHNGADPETTQIIETMGFADEVIRVGGPEMIPLGQAMGTIVNYLGPSGNGLWLHLEDDWRSATTTPARWWLETAARILTERPEIGQVRLRHRCEATKSVNLRTGQPIVWRPEIRGDRRPDPLVLISPTAHYTCNPAMVRIRDAGRIWPALGEDGAMDRFSATGMAVAQLSPGVFHHIGGDQSLEGHPASNEIPAKAPSTVRARGRRPMAKQAPGTIATPRTHADYQGFYERGGWQYDLPAETKVMCMISDLAGWIPGDVIHEIGSGMGDHSGILAKLGYRVTAVERAASGTEATKARYPEVTAVTSDVATWRPEVRGHIFARGMSWYHWELSGVNSNGVDVAAETRALVDRAMEPDGSFVLQIWTDLSGNRYAHKVHDNTLSDFMGLFSPIFRDVNIYDWSGKPIQPGIRHDRGVVVVARQIK